MSAIKELARKSKNTLKEEGLIGLTKKSTKYLYFKASSLNRKYDRGFKDILFINGCSLPHPQRYRVDHQIEQLESFGLSCDKIYYTELTLDILRFYRGFIFYRCPIIPIVEEFIKVAKENNKTCFFDIDDLVFDEKDTKMISALNEMTEEERKLYIDGVNRMGKTLDLCEYGIASTNRLNIEMSKHVKEVYTNRNVASMEMAKYSKEALEKVEKDNNKIIMGYLSGSITHNSDFKLIMPTIIKLLKKYNNLYLEVVGLLDVPKEFEEVKEKIIVAPFVDWKELPSLIRSITINLASGLGLAEFIKSKLRKNICFVLPSTNVSGGIMVAIKHGIFLKKNGYDVTIINLDKKTNKVDKVYEKDDYLYSVGDNRTEFLQYVDTIVATMWLTLEFVRKYYNNKNKKYLVQGMETGFYKFGEYEKIRANATYNQIQGIDYITISKWCQKWLKEDFNTDAKYAPNGIDLSIFKIKERSFKGKIKVLIEGNCKDYNKNVDESFKITNQLNRDKYEIHYLSYEKQPKSWYKVDVFHHKVPHDEVGKIYEECDILLKTSLLESFSYPPLEMMATGGLTVVLPNGGNSEFLKDNENCLLYQPGNIEDAISKIEKISTDENLRNKLIQNGIKTAKSRAWASIEKEIIKLYENES